MKCQVCGDNGASLYIRGRTVCQLCFYSLKQFHFVPFRRVLKRKGLWVKFLEKHPEFIHIDHFGNHRLAPVKITEYLKALDY